MMARVSNRFDACHHHATVTRIVTTHHRYKRPPRNRKAVALEAPAVEGHKRCGDGADAMFQEMKQRIAEAMKKR